MDSFPIKFNITFFPILISEKMLSLSPLKFKFLESFAILFIASIHIFKMSSHRSSVLLHSDYPQRFYI